MDELFTTRTVARILGIHPFTVGRQVDRGLIKAFRTGGGHRRIAASDLRDYLVAHQMPLPPELESGSEKLKLLIVDDEGPVLRAIKRAFKKFASRVEITSTTSGIQALLILGDLKPDAVLIDLKMPELDGLEVCRRVRAFKAFANVKLVAMTSRYRSDVIGTALTAGAIACLAKPIDAEELLTLLAGRRGLAPTCAISGCGEPVRIRGFCSAHHDRRRLFEKEGRIPEVWAEKPGRKPGS